MEHRANHVTSIFLYANGDFGQIEGCHPDADPGLANIETREKRLGIKIPVAAD